MSNEITKPNAGGLGALASLRAGIAQVRASIPASVGGQPLLRLLKDGNWVMGREDNAVTPGTEAVINPASFQTGYSCWTDRKPGQGKNELMGEEMWGIMAQKPPASSLPQHHDPRTQELCAWKDAMSVDLKFLDGAFEGQQALYKVTSVGGIRSLSDILDKIMSKLDSGSEHVYPIITIAADSYNHNSYGRTYTPKFEVVGWADMHGNEESDDGAPQAVDKAVKVLETAPKAVEPEPVAEAAPAGRRRRV